MKQQVNFYGDQFKPKKELLSLQNMLLTWLAGIVLVFAFYNFEIKRAAIAEKSFQMTQQREQHQQSQLRDLQSNFSARGDALVLEKNLQDMQASLNQRNFVLEQLGLKAQGMRKGIAGLMDNLARMPVKGLWLTQINVNQGQLSVSGLTDDAEKIPQLIQKLQSMNALQDKRFSRLEVKTDDENEDLLIFTLQSENQVSAKPEAKGSRR